jgi:dTDP-4-amino-4,6-dideoxy-D-galactose acyltransferase
MATNHKLLEWDSSFLGFAVGKIELFDKPNDSTFSQILEIGYSYKLCYLFSSQELKYKIIDYNKSLFLADIKLIFGIDLKNFPIEFDTIDNNYRVLTEIVPDLNNLALLAGKFSRYKTDPKFNENVFERLYEEWLRKSITGHLADQVVGYYIDDEIAGFITLLKKDNKVSIGLVAVSERFQRLGIGKKLIKFAIDYGIKNKAEQLIVETQAANNPACILYNSIGFKEIDKIYIYHLWS